MTSHIAYDTYLAESGILASSGFESGFEFTNALYGSTSRRCKVLLGNTGQIDFDLGSAKTIDCLCIARHNLGTIGASIGVYVSADDVTYTLQENITPTTDKNIFADLASFSSRYVRLTFSGHTGSDLLFSDILMSKALAFPRRLQDGFTPPEFASEDDFRGNVTAGNQLAGLTVTEKPLKIKVQYKKVPAAWVFANWINVIEGFKKRPVYYRWKESGAVLFCWPYRKIGQPSYKKIYYMDIKFQLEGYTE